MLGLGALLVAAIVVVVLLVTSGGGSKHKQLASQSTTGSPTTSTPATSTPGSTSTTSTTSAKAVGQVNLNSPSGDKNRKGIAEIVRSGSILGVLVIAKNMPPNTTKNAYAVWLFNSNSDSKLLGFVNTRVGSNGRLETEGQLPSNASHYKRMLVTLESKQSPKTPGPVMLEGPFALSASAAG